MLNTIQKNNKKEQNNHSVESILNDIYLLPKWEKIKDITISQKRFMLPSKLVSAFIFRKFSSKNSIEKYALKDKYQNILGNLDLRVYKDSVYIINMNIEQNSSFEEVTNILIQIAAEKALYNTSEKQLKINLLFPNALKNKIKKIIQAEDFFGEMNQSDYEKNMFGETYTLNVETSMFWHRKINKMHILINK